MKAFLGRKWRSLLKEVFLMNDVVLHYERYRNIFRKTSIIPFEDSQWKLNATEETFWRRSDAPLSVCPRDACHRYSDVLHKAVISDTAESRKIKQRSLESV